MVATRRLAIPPPPKKRKTSKCIVLVACHRESSLSHALREGRAHTPEGDKSGAASQKLAKNRARRFLILTKVIGEEAGGFVSQAIYV